MSFPQFLTNLFEDGAVSLPQPIAISPEELQAGAEVIAANERIRRIEFPNEAPAFYPESASWAAVRFFRACQFLLYRELDAAEMSEAFGESLAGPHTPEVHYSVDIIFQYLPDLLRFSKSESADDPLNTHLINWARQWPLSSVGISGLENCDISGFEADAGMLQLYADRIIATADCSRLESPTARTAVTAALGMYPEFAPKLADALRVTTEPESVK